MEAPYMEVPPVKRAILNNKKMKKEIKNKILDEYKKGNIIIATYEGLQITKLSELIKQPTNGLLYDLNRNEETILTFIDDPKWINDFATCKVIRALKSRIDELENKLHDSNTV